MVTFHNNIKGDIMFFKTISQLLFSILILILFSGCCKDKLTFEEGSQLRIDDCSYYYNDHSSYAPFSSVVGDKGVFFYDVDGEGKMYTVDSSTITHIRTLCSGNEMYDNSTGKVYQLWSSSEGVPDVCNVTYYGNSEYDGTNAHGTIIKQKIISSSNPIWVNKSGDLVEGDNGKTTILAHENSNYLDQVNHWSSYDTGSFYGAKLNNIVNIVSNAHLYTYDINTQTEYLYTLPQTLNLGVMKVTKDYVVLLDNERYIYVTGRYGEFWHGPYDMGKKNCCRLFSESDFILN